MCGASCISLGSQNPKSTASMSNAIGHISLFARCSREFPPTPSDIIEEMWVRDVMDLSWDIFRCRGVKTSLIAELIPDTLRRTIAPLANADEHSEWMDLLIKKWVAQKPSAIKQVSRLLASAKLTFDTVIARAIMSIVLKIERIDHWIMIAEGRRNAALREIDRRRAVFAQALRHKMQEVDAEFETVEPKAIVSTGTQNPQHDQCKKNQS